MKKNIVILLAIILQSCSKQTEPISYGKDNCDFCKMTIIDAKYGCEAVSEKGKVFKFDDLSCMVKYLKTAQLPIESYPFVVVSNYQNGSSLIAVKSAVFVSGKQFASPMRGDVAAFADAKAVAEIQKQDSTARVYTWKEILEKFDE